MGRTNQVLTGGSIYSTSPQTTAMKIVLALLVLCLFQFSLAEQEDIDNAETNLVLERDVREAGKRNCKGKNCRKKEKEGREKIQKVQFQEKFSAKERWKEVRKETKPEQEKNKGREKAKWAREVFIQEWQWKKHNGGHMFRGPGCKDEEVQQGPSRVQALQASPDLGKADEEQEDQRSFHVR